MPTYPFTCPNGHSADVVLRMAERNTPQVCEVCGVPMIRAMAAGLPFILWGGRWRDSGWINGKDGFDDGLGPQRE